MYKQIVLPSVLTGYLINILVEETIKYNVKQMLHHFYTIRETFQKLKRSTSPTKSPQTHTHRHKKEHHYKPLKENLMINGKNASEAKKKIARYLGSPWCGWHSFKAMRSSRAMNRMSKSRSFLMGATN